MYICIYNSICIIIITICINCSSTLEWCTKVVHTKFSVHHFCASLQDATTNINDNTNTIIYIYIYIICCVLSLLLLLFIKLFIKTCKYHTYTCKSQCKSHKQGIITTIIIPLLVLIIMMMIIIISLSLYIYIYIHAHNIYIYICCLLW